MINNIELFACPRLSGHARLSIKACSRRYEIANQDIKNTLSFQDRTQRAWFFDSPCRGCNVGQAHAAGIATPAAWVCSKCGTPGESGICPVCVKQVLAARPKPVAHIEPEIRKHGCRTCHAPVNLRQTYCGDCKLQRKADQRRSYEDARVKRRAARPPLPPTQCIQCGKEIVRTSHHKRLFCGNTCALIHWKARHKVPRYITCVICGKEVVQTGKARQLICKDPACVATLQQRGVVRRRAAMRTIPTPVKCLQCGKEIIRTTHHKRYYCCDACQDRAHNLAKASKVKKAVEYIKCEICHTPIKNARCRKLKLCSRCKHTDR
jgi:ribosomal protein S27AE